MHDVSPEVFLIARPAIDWAAVERYLETVGGTAWLDRVRGEEAPDGERLVEFMGRMCFDDQTEILTDEGWKSGLKLDGHEQVLTLDGSTGTTAWQEHVPVAYDYDGELLHFDQRGLDLAVTPEHRLWVQKMQVGGDFGPWHFATADTIGFGGTWRMRRTGSPAPGRPAPERLTQEPQTYRSGRGHLIEKQTLGYDVPTLPYLRFLGYVIAEGFTTSGTGSGATITLTQSEGPVLERMLSTVEDLGLSARVYPDPRKPHVKNVVVAGGGRLFVERVAQDLGGTRAHDKRIPRWVLELDAEHLQELYEGMWEGDGSLTRRGSLVYHTASEGLADDVQELLVRLGRASSIREHVRPDGGRMFRVTELEREHVITRPHQRSLRPYQGRVWCVSTRNGIVLVRRGKTVVWSGNCYRSWAPGLNPNVSRVREDSTAYLRNILRSAHGSVLEHASYAFVFAGCSRVMTHELVRHRAGAAVSQESLRYVRLTDLPFEHPEFVREDPELLAQANALLAQMESFQELVVERTGIAEEGVDFHTKKTVTSAARRYAPDGVGTTIGWTVNIRALRHVIAMRTDPGAEEEIRRVFDQVAQLMVRELPALLGDFTRGEDGAWRPEFPKV